MSVTVNLFDEYSQFLRDIRDKVQVNLSDTELIKFQDLIEFVDKNAELEEDYESKEETIVRLRDTLDEINRMSSDY